MADRDLCFTPATKLVPLIARGAVSPLEVVQAVLARLERVNPRLNAYGTVAAEQAVDAAKRATAAARRRARRGPLHGVPVSIKDLTPTKGIRTTWGSKIYEHHVPEEDALVVARLKAAGAIVLGKTNTPEFGAGANTFNEVFGVTRNPWNPALTPGGSTGGGAVALATGLGPLAQGTDLGGSLRLPAAFCGVVGFRTSPGLVPNHPAPLAWDPWSVSGPMARTVADTALMLSVIAGADPRSPISYSVNPRAFIDAVRRPSARGLRLAWGGDLGVTPVDDEVLRVARDAMTILQRSGARVTDEHPDLDGVHDVVLISRGARVRSGDARQHQRDVRDRPRHRALDSVRLPRKRAGPDGDEPGRGAKADHSAECRWDPERAPEV